MLSINFWMESSILLTLFALCRNAGSGKVRICRTAMLPRKIYLGSCAALIIALLADENHPWTFGIASQRDIWIRGVMMSPR